VVNKVENFEPYQASISKQTLIEWNGIVSVWNSPKSPLEGAKVVDEIREPAEVMVVEEQQETYGLKRKRAKIKYGEGREGWVLSDALTVGK